MLGLAILIWVLIGSCLLLLNFSILKIGNARAMFGIFIIISGLCMYIYGLFSDNWLRWAGSIQILLGLFAPFFLKHTELQIFTSCTFLVGGPLIHYFAIILTNKRMTNKNSANKRLAEINSSRKTYAFYSIFWVTSVFLARNW